MPKFRFLVGFRPLYLGNIEKSKSFGICSVFSFKNRDFWGDLPPEFWTGGGGHVPAIPPPPVATPMLHTYQRRRQGFSWGRIIGRRVVGVMTSKETYLPPNLYFSYVFVHLNLQRHGLHIFDKFSRTKRNFFAGLEKWLQRWGDQVSGGPKGEPL